MTGNVVGPRRRAASRVPRRPRGVSLLEMLVALTILATAGAALFGWVYQVSSQLSRLNASQQQAMAKLTALQYLKSINPSANANGSQRFTDFVLRWQAVAATPMRSVLNTNDAPLAAQVGVFDVTATLQRPGDAQAWLSFQTQLPGWIAPAGASLPVAAPGNSGGSVR